MDEFEYIEYPFLILVAPPALFLKAAAYRGEEMLEGLTSAAQTFFIKARNLYTAGIESEQGKREMIEAVQAYERDEAIEIADFEKSQFWIQIEESARKYADSAGTPEGDRFYAAVYGTTDDWRLKRERTIKFL